MKKRILALLCALALTVGLVGCVISTPDTVGTIGDCEITSGLYLLAQFDAYQKAADLASSEQDASKVKSFLKETITVDADTEETAVVSDYVAEQTLKNLETYAAIETRYDELGGQLTAEEEYETILERMTQIVEHALQITIRRDTFNYARFATHVQYLLKRVQTDSPIDSDNLQMYASIRDEYKDVSACVDQIHEYLQRNWSIDLSEEEKLYLIMHINRVISQEL